MSVNHVGEGGESLGRAALLRQKPFRQVGLERVSCRLHNRKGMREREADPIYVIIIQIIDSFSFVHVHKKTKPGSREGMISLKTPNE